MEDDEADADPLAQMLRDIAAKRRKRADEHRAIRDSEAYRGSIRQIEHYILDYGLGINAIDVCATRFPPYFDELIRSGSSRILSSRCSRQAT
jgi:hypothetical protein